MGWILKICLLLAAGFFFCSRIDGQVKITSITQSKSNSDWLNYSFHFISYRDTSVAGRINRYLHKDVLENDVVETRAEKIFEKSRYILNDTISHSGLSMISYTVEVNNPKIFSLKFELESTGAYSEYYSRGYNFNLKHGVSILAHDLFTVSGLEKIKKILIRKRQREIEKWIKEIKTDFTGGALEDTAWIRETFSNCNKDADENSFLIKKNSVLFYKDYCFPHAARPFDINLDIILSFKEIIGYLNDKGKRLLFQLK